MKKEKNNKANVKMAAAIKYDAEKNSAPQMTARGQGNIAEKILQLAHDHGIPIKNDPDLIQVLSKLKIGAEIPVELYRAVAEILAFVYNLNEEKRSQSGGS